MMKIVFKVGVED